VRHVQAGHAVSITVARSYRSVQFNGMISRSAVIVCRTFSGGMPRAVPVQQDDARGELA
jgi:hypothetical protein